MNGKDYHELAIKQIKAALGWVVNSKDVAGILDGSITL